MRNYFKNQFCKRNTKDVNLPKKWEKIYNPIKKIQDNIYDGLEKEISEVQI